MKVASEWGCHENYGPLVSLVCVNLFSNVPKVLKITCPSLDPLIMQAIRKKIENQWIRRGPYEILTFGTLLSKLMHPIVSPSLTCDVHTVEAFTWIIHHLGKWMSTLGH